MHHAFCLASAPASSLHEDILEAQKDHEQHMKSLTTIAATFFDPHPSYPTTSSQEQAVTSFYGSLHVGEPTLTYIKKYYFYLEYLSKIEYAGRLLAKAKNAGIPFLEIIKTYGWLRLKEQVNVKSYSELSLLDPAWPEVQACIAATLNHEIAKPSSSFWQDLANTSFWKSLTLTPDDIEKTIFWQNYLKFTIYNSLSTDQNLLFSRYESELAIFKYLPNIEVAYFHPDFTQLRTSSELASIALVLNEHKRNRLLRTCVDWQKYLTPKGLPDLNVLDVITTFSKTTFYTMANNLITFNSTLQKQPMALQPPGQEQLICLTMIIILQTFLTDIFTTNKLAATMAILKKTPQQPRPSILPYGAEDYPYLYELNILKNEVAVAAQDAQQQEQKQASQGSASNLILLPQKTRPQVVVQNFADWLEQRGNDVWNTIKSTGEAIYATARDVEKVIEDETKTIYYSSGLASVIQQLPPEQAQQLAQSAQAAVSGDFESFRQDTKKLLQGVVKLATYPADFEIEAVLTGIGQLLNDPALAKDFQGYWNAIIDTTAEVLATPLQAGSIAVEAGLKLSVDGIHLISQVVIDVFTGQNVGSDISAGFKQLAYDIVSGVLASITFTIEKLKEELADVMKACGYLVKLLTDLIIDIGADIAAIGKYLYLQAIDPGSVDLGSLYKQQQAALGEHRHLIAQIVTASLIIIGSAAFTVATGGVGLPLAAALIGGAAFNVGFGVFMGMTGYQADQEIALLKQEQHDYVETFSVWTLNKESMVQAQQEAVIEELDKKFSAEITNQERSLGFFQNFLTQAFENAVEQESNFLGTYQAALLTPDPATNAVYADIGSLYGYNTRWLDLNPSQGFALFAPSRMAASQEIAEFPKSITTDTGTSQLFWFKQKVTQDLANPVPELSVDIRVQAIYVLSAFYLGLSLGGHPLDKNTILNEQRADIARDHLAKMLVFKRTEAQGAITFGVYEHEGQGWITQTLTSPPFDIGVWYRIKATLAGTTLRVKVWQEGQREPDWSTFTVAQTGQQTIGVIFSGASIEWEMLQPSDKNTVKPLPALYKPYRGPVEKDREASAQKNLSDLSSYTFGSHKLDAVGIPEILKNQFIYTTKDTHIAQETANKNTRDYVILGQLDANTQTTLTTAGLSPKASPNALISLISGKFFDQAGQQKGISPTAWSAYKSAHRVSDDLTTIINNEREIYAQRLIGPYQFGTFTLSASSPKDITQGHYIYTTTAGDYVLMAQLDSNNNILAIAMPYDQKINGIVSFVSGNVYTRNSAQPATSGYTNQLTAYQQQHGPLRKELFDAISAAEKKYQTTQQPTEQKNVPPAEQPAQPLIITPPPSQQTGTIISGPPTLPPDSLSERQKEASGSDWS
jgi:hypothetical protein